MPKGLAATTHLPKGDQLYSAECTQNVEQFLHRAAELGSSAAVTPFQTADWLGPWFRTIGPAKALKPVLVTVREAASGRTAMLLPLVLRRSHGVTILEFADLSVSDYSVPLLGPAAPETPWAATEAWRAVLGCLPKADLVRLQNLPQSVGSRTNPLALLPVQGSSKVRNIMALPASWEDYLAARSKSFRKGQRQKRRTINRPGDVSFRIVTDSQEAYSAIAALDAFQRRRLAEIGENYVLDHPPYSHFYRELIRQGLASRFVVLSTLTQGRTMLAAAFGMRLGSSFTMVRLANIGGEWSRFSPSFVLVGQTIKWLIETGTTLFDFGAGDGLYKRHFGCRTVPLFTYEQPLNMKGRTCAAALRGRNFIRENSHYASPFCTIPLHF